MAKRKQKRKMQKNQVKERRLVKRISQEQMMGREMRDKIWN